MTICGYDADDMRSAEGVVGRARRGTAAESGFDLVGDGPPARNPHWTGNQRTRFVYTVAAEGACVA